MGILTTPSPLGTTVTLSLYMYVIKCTALFSTFVPGNANGLLLATDVAARGLDIPGVQHVIHYQVPRTTEVCSNDVVFIC